MKKIVICSVIALLIALAVSAVASEGDLEKARTLTQQARELFEQEKYREALEPAMEALALREQFSGPQDPDLAASLYLLAEVYDFLAMFDQAEPLYRRALDIREKILEPEDPKIVKDLENLAQFYSDLNAFRQAVPLYKRALEIKEKIRGPEHPETADTLNDLGWVFQNQHQNSEAEHLHLRALEIREKVLGPEHQETAASLGNLTRLYHSESVYKVSKAQPVGERALAIREKVLGPEHPETVESLTDLILIYKRQDSKINAKPFIKRLLDLKVKILGPEHPYTVMTRNDLVQYQSYSELMDRAKAVQKPGRAKSKTRPGSSSIQDMRKRLQSFKSSLEMIQRDNEPGSAQKYKAAGNQGPATQTEACLYNALGVYDQTNTPNPRALAIIEKALRTPNKDTYQGLKDLKYFLYRFQPIYPTKPLNRRLMDILAKVLDTGQTDTAQRLNDLADFLVEIKARELGVPLYGRALALNEKNLGPDDLATARSLYSLGKSYCEQHDIEKAEPLLSRALEIREKKLGPDHPKVAETLVYLALTYQRKEEPDRAGPLFLRALAIREKESDPENPAMAETLHYLALFHQDRGALDQAQPLLERSLAIREKVLGPDHPDTLDSLDDLADLYKAGGAYEKAEALYKHLASKEEKAGVGLDSYRRSDHGLASLYWEMGDDKKGEPLYRRHLDFYGTYEKDGLLFKLKGGEDLGQLQARLAQNEKLMGANSPLNAHYLTDITWYYVRQGAYSQAEQYAKRLLALKEKKPRQEQEDQAQGLDLLAAVYKYMGAYDRAEPLYKKALAIREKAGGIGKIRLFDSLNNLASIYQAMGAPEMVEPLYRSALALKQINQTAEAESEYLANSGLSQLEMGNFEFAAAYFEDCIQVFETVRAELAQSDKRSDFQSMTDDVYGDLCVAQLVLGHYQKALEALERGRAKSFMDLLGTRELGRKESADRIARLTRLEEKLAQTREQKMAAWSAPQGQKTRAAELVQEITGLDRERLKLIEEIQKADPELGSLVAVDPPTLSEIQSLLEPDMVLLEYYHLGEYRASPNKNTFGNETREHLWIFAVHRDGLHFKAVDVNKNELVKTLTDYAGLLADPGSDPARIKALSAKLHGWLVQPLNEILTKIKPQTLVVVPWGPMFKTPLATLTPKNGAPLGTEYNLVVSPSAGLYRYVIKKRNEKRGRLAALGDPKTALPPLPGAQEEAREIALLFDDFTVTLGEKATETLIKSGYDKLGRPDVIHLACHGHFNEAEPRLSYLALTPDQANDGKLEMHEVFGLDWKGVSLVTLSACSSGQAKLGGGQDLVGLMRGFMFSGAPSVLASLWKVDDAATRELMVQFYKNYLAGQSKPQALRKAQMTLSQSDKWSHPYYWSAFVLYGDWK